MSPGHVVEKIRSFKRFQGRIPQKRLFLGKIVVKKRDFLLLYYIGEMRFYENYDFRRLLQLNYAFSRQKLSSPKWSLQVYRTCS